MFYLSTNGKIRRIPSFEWKTRDLNKIWEHVKNANESEYCYMLSIHCDESKGCLLLLDEWNDFRKTSCSLPVNQCLKDVWYTDDFRGDAIVIFYDFSDEFNDYIYDPGNFSIKDFLALFEWRTPCLLPIPQKNKNSLVKLMKATGIEFDEFYFVE